MHSTDADEQAGNGLHLRARNALAEGNYAGALELLGAAADLGHESSAIQLARMLMFGVGIEPQPLQGVRRLHAAEAGGSVEAAYLLAQVAAGGTLLPLDATADARVLRGVEARFAPAMRAAALVFARKQQPQAQRIATQLLKAAANRGDSVAAQILVERLALGIGQPADATAVAALVEQLAAVEVPRLPSIGIPQDASTHDADSPTGGATDLVLADYLRPPPTVQLSDRPAVRRVPSLLNAAECGALIGMAMPLLRPSRTVDPGSGAATRLQLRTSCDAQFDVLQEDLSLRLIQARLAAAAGLPLDQAESLIVLRYEPGQEYRPHRDYLTAAAIARDRPHAGNRMRSLCVYLNQVEAGGATQFPHADLRVEPHPGDAIVFDNLDADGAPDESSLHAGLPVERGVKWLATLWFRQRPYRYF